MKTLFDVSYAKFYGNYYVVYSTCFNKFNCNDTFKYINAKTFITKCKLFEKCNQLS